LPFSDVEIEADTRFLWKPGEQKPLKENELFLLQGFINQYHLDAAAD
jgi:hypothetical protein